MTKISSRPSTRRSSRPSSKPSSVPNSFSVSSPSSKPVSKCKSKFSISSASGRGDHEELIEEYRNFIQNRQTRQVLLLCTDLKDKLRAKHVVDSAVALRNSGHKYAFNLSQYRMPASKIRFKGTWFPGQCLESADEILVPNKTFYDIYKRSFSAKINANICEPYLNVRMLKKEKILPLNQVLEDMNKETIMFLVLAEYHPRSNLELALDSFHLLVHSVEHSSHLRLRLVVAGHAGRGRLGYVRQLGARVRRLHLDSRVLLHPRPTRQHKKALLSGCRALLCCQEQGLWDRYMLEAMALARPVIAVDSGFSAEVLQHGVTGYLVAPNPDAFAVAMAEVAGVAGRDEFLGKMAHCEFLKTYSLEAYAQRLNQIVSDITQLDKDKDPMRSENLFTNKELFFG